MCGVSVCFSLLKYRISLHRCSSVEFIILLCRYIINDSWLCGYLIIWIPYNVSRIAYKISGIDCYHKQLTAIKTSLHVAWFRKYLLISRELTLQITLLLHRKAGFKIMYIGNEIEFKTTFYTRVVVNQRKL